MVSPNPTSNPVPNCMKVLGNFPANIMMAVGTTFSKLKRAINKGSRMISQTINVLVL